MSEALYPVRVYFDGQMGCVKTPGVYRKISACPRIPGLPLIEEIDYAPFVVADLTPQNGAPRREMYAAEVEAVQAFLICVLAGKA